MTYTFVQDVPIDAAFYARIKQGLGDEPPKGLISHVAIEVPRVGCATSTFGSPKSCSKHSERH